MLALATDSDWLQGSAEDALDEYEVETSALSYLDVLLARERYEFDYVPLLANLSELIPSGDESENQVVLKAVDYSENGMSSFDAFHAAITETQEMDVLSSEKDSEDIEVARVPLESADEE